MSSIYPEADRYRGNNKYLNQKEDNLRRLEEKERIKKLEEREKEEAWAIKQKLEELNIQFVNEMEKLSNERSHLLAETKKVNLKYRLTKAHFREEAYKIKHMFDTKE
jgi:hypothetical protein